jgi:predicted HTH domain antitoxin
MWQANNVSEVKLKMSPGAIGAELQLAAAMKLYELGRISAGAAAQLACLSGLGA